MWYPQVPSCSHTIPGEANSSKVSSTLTDTDTHPQPYLVTSKGVLFNSDCLDVLPLVCSESVHTVFADPPFNLNKEYGNGFSDSWTDDDYLDWCCRWIEECCRVLVDGGALFIYSLPRWAFHLAHHLDNRSMQFRHWIALSMKGTYPRGKKLYPAHYALLYFTKGEPRVYNRLRVPVPQCRHCGKDIKDYGGHRKALNPDGLNLTDFWDDTSPVRHRKFKVRPGINELKPVIPGRAILMSSEPGDVVLDPFGGGGSTYQQAEVHDRKWLGMEIGDCSIIRERLTDLTVKLDAKRLPGGFPSLFSTAVRCPK